MIHKIRSDAEGDGHWNAVRAGGKRWHKGADLVWKPGAPVRAFWTGKVIRKTYPYQGDYHYKGLVIHGPAIRYRIWYIDFDSTIIGLQVRSGDFIGYAQRVAKKYGPKMINHIHVQIDSIDPEILLKMEDWHGNVKRLF